MSMEDVNLNELRFVWQVLISIEDKNVNDLEIKEGFFEYIYIENY